MATPDPNIKLLKSTSAPHTLSQIVDTFANIIEFVDDDPACFFALALLLNDMTNLSRPKDPAKLIRDLNDFFLSVDCDGPMSASQPELVAV